MLTTSSIVHYGPGHLLQCPVAPMRSGMIQRLRSSVRRGCLGSCAGLKDTQTDSAASVRRKDTRITLELWHSNLDKGPHGWEVHHFVVGDEWVSAAFSEGEKDIDDEYLNEVCNKAIKAMLRGDDMAVQSIQDELYEMGSFFEGRENEDGALFTVSLIKLTQHEISRVVDCLTGKYKDAFMKVFGIVEDSGWQLKREGEDDDEDENSLPPMGSGMYGF